MRIEKAPDDLLPAILPCLDRGDSRKWPDGKGEYWSLCPFHDDGKATNFSVSERGYKCFACGASGGLVALADHLGLLPERTAPARGQTSTPAGGLTLAEYAEAKKLPADFLAGLGLSDIFYGGKRALRVPYADADGQEVAVRFRLAMQGDNRFRWRRGSKVALYGLGRLAEVRKAGYTLLVEGESDCHTLWYHDLPALGVPGASTWRDDWAALLAGLRVYIWREPDAGGDTLAGRVARSLPDALLIVPPEGVKDISQVHMAGDDVPALVKMLLDQAQPARELLAQQQQQAQADALAQAGELPNLPDILGAFLDLVRRLGLAGEKRNAQLLYLALTSRLLDRPVSLVVKGPSSGGKSFLLETVLRAFPPEAVFCLSAMSERALAYSDEPLAHRFLVLYEAAGLGSDFASYLLRSLLSEGRVRYETVEKTAEGMKPRLIERPGPTGLILTTTRAGLHPENETRMFSLCVADDPAQTRAVLRASAGVVNGAAADAPDLLAWHGLQSWLASCPNRVAVPFAGWLAEHVDAGAVRLRRDFGALLRLVQAHALLHQERRRRDDKGRVLAEAADYAAVHALVSDLVAEGVQAGVSAQTREAVEAVRELEQAHGDAATGVQVADALGLDPSAARRRLYAARAAGYVVNVEERRGRPARWKAGDPLPEERQILPSPFALAAAVEGGEGIIPPPKHLHACTPIAESVQACTRSGGDIDPSPPYPDDAELWQGAIT